MATKTFKVALSLDNPRIIHSGIEVRSFDKQSIKIDIELTKNSQVYQIPAGAQIKISLLKLARKQQKIILDVPYTKAEAIEWVVPDYLDGYQGDVRVGVYLIVGGENVDVGYFNMASNVSDIDKAAEEFTDRVMQGWAQIEADLAEVRATITQVNTLASNFTADVASKYNEFDTHVTQAEQTIDDTVDDFTADVTNKYNAFDAVVNDKVATINDTSDTFTADVVTKNTQVNTLASNFTADVATKQSDVTSKYDAFDESVMQANQTIDGILGLADDVQQIGVELNKKANKAQEAWITPTLLNGWTTTYDGVKSRYFKDQFGVVHLEVAVKRDTAAGIQIMQLPAGYRPSQYVFFSAGSNIVTQVVPVHIGPGGILECGYGYALSVIFTISFKAV